MQEIHSMGGGGKFFSGGGTGDRRLRPHSHHQQNNDQALKCPRCDSLNTKFCYYNNYNLSQPCPFCKNCRRYWTKGGVLRNVLVGGGCRKSKRSSNNTKKTSKTASTTSSEETPPQTTSSQQPEHNSNSHSSSESSSLTAAAATATVTELNSDSSNNYKLNEPKSLLIHQNPSSNPNLESGNALEQGAGDCGGIFSEIGTFTSLIASSSANNDALAFGFGGVGVVPDATSFQWQHQQHQKIPDGLSGVGGGGNLLDHGHGAVTVDLSALQGKNGHGGFGPLDWQGGGGADHQGLFDLPNAVDQAYWSHTQWSDQDNSSLFHLP